MSVRLRAHSRLHMGLLDLGYATARTYGGLGFFVEDPYTEIEVQKAKSSTLSNYGLDERDRRDLIDAISRWETETGGNSIEVTIHQVPPQHTGLGTKTGLILAIYAGARGCWDIDLTNHQLKKLSGRGGVSGIGVNGFFSGGFIADAGQPKSEINTHQPSSATEPADIPPVNSQVSMPEDWQIRLYLPEGNQYHGEAELELFDRNTPIPEEEVYESISVAYHGIVPAFKQGDLNALSRSLKKFHSIGFKSRELNEQPEQVKEILASFQELDNVAAGMSSTGPLIYTLQEANQYTPQNLIEYDVELFQKTKPCNSGVDIAES